MGRKERKEETAGEIIKEISKYLDHLAEESEKQLASNKSRMIFTRPAHRVHHTRAGDKFGHGFDVEEAISVKYRFEFTNYCDKRSLAAGNSGSFTLCLRLQVVDMIYHLNDALDVKNGSISLDKVSLRPISDKVCREQICYKDAVESDVIQAYYNKMREMTKKANHFIKHTFNLPIKIVPYTDELYTEVEEGKGNPEQYQEYFMDMAILSKRFENTVSLDSVLKACKRYGVTLDLSEESIEKHLAYKKVKGYTIKPYGTCDRALEAIKEREEKGIVGESMVFTCDKSKGQREFRNEDGLTRKDIAKQKARSKEELIKVLREANQKKLQSKKESKKKFQSDKKVDENKSTNISFMSKLKKKFNHFIFNIKWTFRKRHHGSDDYDYQSKHERKERYKHEYTSSSLSFDFDAVSFLWVLIPTIIVILMAILSCLDLVASGRQMLEDWGRARLNNIQTFYISRYVIDNLFKGSFMSEVFVLLQLLLYLLFIALIIIGGIIDIILVIVYFLFMAVLTLGVFWFVGYMSMFFAPAIATIIVLIRTIIFMHREENGFQSFISLLVCIIATIIYYVTFAPGNMFF